MDGQLNVRGRVMVRSAYLLRAKASLGAIAKLEQGPYCQETESENGEFVLGDVRIIKSKNNTIRQKVYFGIFIRASLARRWLRHLVIKGPNKGCKFDSNRFAPSSELDEVQPSFPSFALTDLALCHAQTVGKFDLS